MLEETKKPKKGWLVVILVVVILLVIAAAAFFLRGKDHSEDDYEDGDADVVGYEDVGTVNYYAGIVEAQKVLEVNKDADKEIAELLVAVGDEVAEGQALFSYDTAEMTLKLEQARIELDSIGNDITDYQNQINQLNKDLKAADPALKLDYQMQISELSTSIKQSQLSQRTKQAEITSIERSIENSTVHSTIDGVVKTIAKSSMENGPYMTILATGTYLVKATVDEMNVGSLSEGLSVTVHSRVDDATWKGTISKIDAEEKAENDQGNMYYDGGQGDGSTKYYFYVELESIDGLLLGQHVFVEPELSYDDFSDEMEDAGYEPENDDLSGMEEDAGGDLPETEEVTE